MLVFGISSIPKNYEQKPIFVSLKLRLAIKWKPFDESSWDLCYEVTNQSNFVKLVLAFFGLYDLDLGGQGHKGQNCLKPSAVASEHFLILFRPIWPLTFMKVIKVKKGRSKFHKIQVICDLIVKVPWRFIKRFSFYGQT